MSNEIAYYVIWIIAIGSYIFFGFIFPQILQKWIDRWFR